MNAIHRYNSLLSKLMLTTIFMVFSVQCTKHKGDAQEMSLVGCFFLTFRVGDATNLVGLLTCGTELIWCT